MSADDTSVSMTKTLLRQAIRQRRGHRTAAQRAADDHDRSALLRIAIRELAPRRVASYLSAGTEPDTRETTEWLHELGVAQIMPVVTADDGERRTDPAWARYEGPDRLRTGWRSMTEPDGPALPGDAVRSADLVLCPGLAGSNSGSRLGRGGGWYDRVLITVTAPVWLLLNDDEVLDDLPQQAWDLPVAALVTPTHLVQCQH